MQLRQVALIYRLAFHAGLQLHHVGEERRLRAAEVVGAVAVGNMPVGVDQVGKVVQHLAAERGFAALHQAQHGEVGIPVIHLAEASARHHIRMRQRQQAAVRRHVVLAAHQLGPQQVDVLAQRGVLADRIGLHRRRFFEIGVHELAQIEAGVIVLGQIVGVDQRRVAQRQEVDKVLLVIEQLTALHGLKQFRVGQVGRGRRGRRRIDDRSVQRRGGQRARRNKHAQRQAKQRRAARGRGRTHDISRTGSGVGHGKRPVWRAGPSELPARRRASHGDDWIQQADRRGAATCVDQAYRRAGHAA